MTRPTTKKRSRRSRDGVPRAAPADAVPAARDVLHCVGGEWSVLVISLLGDGSGSAAELARSIEGASERVLAPALRALERDGLVCRTASPGGEARAIYELTPLGKSVLDPAVALATWAELHRFDVGDARARHDGRGRTGPGR